MDVIISLTIIISLLVLSMILAVSNRKKEEDVERRAMFFPRVLAASSAMMICGFLFDSANPFRLLTDLLLLLLMLSLLQSSILSEARALACVKVLLCCGSAISLYYLAGTFGLVPHPASRTAALASCALSVAVPSFLVASIGMRLHSVKEVVKSGNVWSSVCFSVDVLYAVFPVLVCILVMMVDQVTGGNRSVHVWCAAVLIFMEITAFCLRNLYDSVFVIMHNHERVIVESMKLPNVEAVVQDSRNDELYREVYERVLLYFEMNKPFLNGDLTINDIAKVVYSNKVYISKAICHYTGRNFRQFVNYYRVKYSMDRFRELPDLKVSELAELSGFNTVVSYTMAFRLFMNETPSEWCRKERSKVLKNRK